MTRITAGVGLLVIFLSCPRADAQQIDGPPPPAPPTSIARDVEGKATIRATRVATPLRIDGQLDESLYGSVTPVSDFIQVEPNDGAPATQKTELWVAFDQTSVYVSFRVWESQPDRMIVNEMRRDSTQNILQNEAVAFILDTYYDRRNGALFHINAIGGRLDGQVTDERQYNSDWNPIWDYATGRFDGGWTLEAAVPFKSLRYRPGREQVWGLNARRINRWKNEISYVTRVPNALGIRGIFQVSAAATLVGIEAPPGARSLELKPYAIFDLTTDATVSPAIRNDVGGDAGLDVKYGVTQNLTADFTYNTDFAQVEADEEQVNLTRFSLFFPEKREFFLENQGLFQFGGVTGRFGGDTPILFFSRRIGLDSGREIGIQAGGRLTGRVGAFSVGALNIRTDEDAGSNTPSTNFSVLRIKRDVLRRSSIGGIFTRRSVALNGAGSNETYGIDGTFAFFNNFAINTYWARTRTEGRSTDDTSYRMDLNYNGDRYGVELERLRVGENFNPEMGFLRRDDLRKSFAQFRFSPRPASIASIRKFSWIGSLTYIEDGPGRLETRESRGEAGIEFENSDSLNVSYTHTYEFLKQPFPIAPGVTIPVGGYSFGTLGVRFTMGQQRRSSGILSFQQGSFFGGDKTTVGYSRGRVEISPRLAIEPSVSMNRVTLPVGSFTTNLLNSRLTYTLTPKMFVSGLVQYNSSRHSVAANVRFRWEYRPGSELFIVYNDTRDTEGLGFPDLETRSFVVKINRLFRF